MTKTFNISCDIDLFNEFKQLINSRGNKVSTVLQEYMKREINQSNRNYEEIEARITELERIVREKYGLDKGDIEENES